MKSKKVKKTLVESLTDAHALLLNEWCEIEERAKRKQFFIEVIEPFMECSLNIINTINKKQ